MKRIYLDYAASTPVDPKVLDSMKPYFLRVFGNATSIHAEGREAMDAISKSRKIISGHLKCSVEEIVFTGSATEANNLAIFGLIEEYQKSNPGKKTHIITTKIEHHAVLNPFKKLEEQGVLVTYLDVNEEGLVNPNDLKNLLTPETVLISIIYGNNEIGTVQPIKEITRIVRNYRNNKEGNKAYPVVHSDCSQVVGYEPIEMDSLGLDMASFTAQKFYGPKGVGFLFKRRRVPMSPTILGGGQESGLRSGTPNTPLIIGMALALDMVIARKEKEIKRLYDLQNYFFKNVSLIEGVNINGSIEHRLPNNINVSFPGVEAEQMVIELDARGIAVSSGSACTSLSNMRMSEVVYESTRDEERARNAVRISMGHDTKKSHLDLVIKYAKEVINKQKLVINTK